MSADASLNRHHSHSYEDLARQAKASEVVFRVHDALSASPLVWTGLPHDSGFRSPHAFLSCLTPRSYAHLDAKLLRSLYGRYTMVDHILRKWRQSCIQIPMTVQQGPDIPADDMTVWISASTDLIWCIWEIARRLSVKEEDDMFVDTVGLAIIAYDSGLARSDQLSDDKARRPARGSGELHVIPENEADLRLLPLLRPFRTVQLGQQFESAQRAARSSGEVLFYGRIFPGSIVANLEFSTKKLPLELPDWMFVAEDDMVTETNGAAHHPAARHEGHERTKAGALGPNAASEYKTTARWFPGHHLGPFEQPLEGWLSRLVWDPRHDTLEICRKNISQRKRELRQSR